MQQQEILAHAVSGAVKAVMLADGKGADGKDPPPLGGSDTFKAFPAQGQGSQSQVPDQIARNFSLPTNGQVPNASSKAHRQGLVENSVLHDAGV
jgi:hypothetical protein